MRKLDQSRETTKSVSDPVLRYCVSTAKKKNLALLLKQSVTVIEELVRVTDRVAGKARQHSPILNHKKLVFAQDLLYSK